MSASRFTNSSYIIGAKRSPIAPRGGALSTLNLRQLASPVIRALLISCGVDSQQVDELIVGNALGAGGNPARLLALASGLDETVAGLSIDRQCCSGLDAILVANDMIVSGRASIVVAGGVESYSQRPHRFNKIPGTDTLQAYDQPAFTPWPERDPDMTAAAHALAKKLDISFERQNQYAIRSHEKALNAVERLSGEIVPMAQIDKDDFTRKLNTKLCERASRLHGGITVANTAVAADGAAFCLIVSESVANSINGYKLCIRSGTTMGADPMFPGHAPVSAIDFVLQDANISAEQLVRTEIMEAYAAQAIACIEQTTIDETKSNVGGGALARGHPIGASGAVLMSRLFTEMNGKHGWGIATIAAAGGLGTAVLVHSG